MILRSNLRRRGIGRRLVRSALRFCQRQGYADVRLRTVESMTAAIWLYESVGFEQVGAEEVECDGQPVVIRHYGKKLA